MDKVNRFLIPEVGIYWIYPIVFLNILLQSSYIVGLSEKYAGGEIGWTFTAVYLISVAWEFFHRGRNR